MLLHSSPKARYVKSKRDLSHIELTRSGNISSSSKARTYRVGEAHISTKEKNKSKNRRIFSFYSCSFCLYKVLGLAHFAFVRTNAMLALSRVLKFSAKTLPIGCVPFFFFPLFV